ncbi:DUF1289 domain-containing protein [Sphingomonas sp.]|jgi:hypothetical protein|uniref:DUF1289 domain-containing protein n=1 Tax=Sphingomonas sp. TaxID=28214 RepID=UPI002D80A4FB|nr:DUF1289 domain-containing protein [Sphingomonas sp.]HEU0043472.1 DUF1289 domain-containing protein [Sphingomonas sp.]
MIEYVTPVDVASPCIGICVMDDASGWCEGCGRTLDEIAGWLTMTRAQRDAVMAALARRQAA